MTLVVCVSLNTLPVYSQTVTAKFLVVKGRDVWSFSSEDVSTNHCALQSFTLDKATLVTSYETAHYDLSLTKVMWTEWSVENHNGPHQSTV